jgi:hypothetical protein
MQGFCGVGVFLVLVCHPTYEFMSLVGILPTRRPADPSVRIGRMATVRCRSYVQKATHPLDGLHECDPLVPVTNVAAGLVFTRVETAADPSACMMWSMPRLTHVVVDPTMVHAVVSSRYFKHYAHTVEPMLVHTCMLYFSNNKRHWFQQKSSPITKTLNRNSNIKSYLCELQQIYLKNNFHKLQTKQQKINNNSNIKSFCHAKYFTTNSCATIILTDYNKTT